MSLLGLGTILCSLSSSPTEAQTPTPRPTVAIGQQKDRQTLQFPILCNGTPIPDNITFGLNLTGADCTQSRHSVQGRSEMRQDIPIGGGGGGGSLDTETPTRTFTITATPTLTQTPQPTLTPIPCDPCTGGLQVLSEDVDCVGDYSDALTLIPAGVEVIKVHAEVMDTLDPLSSYSIGLPSLRSLWGEQLIGFVGAENDMTTYVWRNPAVFKELTPIRLWFDQTITSGTVRLTITFTEVD